MSGNVLSVELENKSKPDIFKPKCLDLNLIPRYVWVKIIYSFNLFPSERDYLEKLIDFIRKEAVEGIDVYFNGKEIDLNSGLNKIFSLAKTNSILEIKISMDCSDTHLEIKTGKEDVLTFNCYPIGGY